MIQLRPQSNTHPRRAARHGLAAGSVIRVLTSLAAVAAASHNGPSILAPK